MSTVTPYAYERVPNASHFLIGRQWTQNAQTTCFDNLISYIVELALALSQVSSDWTKCYGPPTAERNLLRDGVILTVFYSNEGRTCKADLELTRPQPFASFDSVLNDIIPLNERGKEIRSIGLTSSLNGIASTDYERVHISVNSSGTGTAKGATTGNVVSATISWKGVPCKLEEQKIATGK